MGRVQPSMASGRPQVLGLSGAFLADLSGTFCARFRRARASLLKPGRKAPALAAPKRGLLARTLEPAAGRWKRRGSLSSRVSLGAAADGGERADADRLRRRWQRSAVNRQIK